MLNFYKVNSNILDVAGIHSIWLNANIAKIRTHSGRNLTYAQERSILDYDIFSVRNILLNQYFVSKNSQVFLLYFFVKKPVRSYVNTFTLVFFFCRNGLAHFQTVLCHIFKFGKEY